MVWNAHASVGVAQAAFYIPAFIAAAYLLFVKHGRPRMGWYGLTVFTAVRIAGGIVLALYEQHQSSVGWIIAATILQGTGVFPLILCTIGLLRLIKHIDFADSQHFKRAIIFLRLVFLVSVLLVVVGSTKIGNYKDENSVNLGLKLAKVGYAVIAVGLAIMAGFDGYLWSRYSSLSYDKSRKLLWALTASFPFLAVRITYACLSVFQPTAHNYRWNTLFGSVPALVVMHSLMEYLVVVIYVAAGHSIPAIRDGDTRDTHSMGDEEGAK